MDPNLQHVERLVAPWLEQLVEMGQVVMDRLARSMLAADDVKRRLLHRVPSLLHVAGVACRALAAGGRSLYAISSRRMFSTFGG